MNAFAATHGLRARTDQRVYTVRMAETSGRGEAESIPATHRDDTDRYLVAVYEELRRRAREAMKHLPPGHTIQPTALVHEAYANLVRRNSPCWESEQHFLAIATRAIQSAIVDRIRTRQRLKRGGGSRREGLDTDIPLAMPRAADATVLGVDRLVGELREVDFRAADVVAFRFFLGMTELQCAAVLGVTERTIRRDWTFAKAWLASKLERDNESETSS